MKARHIFSALLALGVAFFSLTDLAEAQKGGREGKRSGGRGEKLTEEQKAEMREKRVQQMEAMYEELGLNEEQKKAMQELQVRRKTEKQTQREKQEAGEKPSAEDREVQRAQEQAELAKILTPEQLTQYKELKKKHGENGGDKEGRRGGGKRGETTEKK